MSDDYISDETRKIFNKTAQRFNEKGKAMKKIVINDREYADMAEVEEHLKQVAAELRGLGDEAPMSLVRLYNELSDVVLGIDAENN